MIYLLLFLSNIIAFADTQKAERYCEDIFDNETFRLFNGKVIPENESLSKRNLEVCLRQIRFNELKACIGEPFRFVKNTNPIEDGQGWNIVSTAILAQTGTNLIVGRQSSICGSSSALQGKITVKNSILNSVKVSTSSEFGFNNTSLPFGGEFITNQPGGISNTKILDVISITSPYIGISESTFHGPMSIEAAMHVQIYKLTLGEENGLSSNLRHIGETLNINNAVLKGSHIFEGATQLYQVTFPEGSNLHTSTASTVTANGPVNIGPRVSLSMSNVNGAISIVNSCPTSSSTVRYIEAAQSSFSYSFNVPGGDSYGYYWGHENYICYWPGPNQCYEYGRCE